MSARLKSLLLLHFTIILYGFTGILGKLISLPADQLVWHRMWIGGVVIGLYQAFSREYPALTGIQKLKLLGFGVIIALHWLTFFASIKVSNVSVALTCFASGSLFTAFLEPLFYRKKVVFYEVVLGLIVILALVLIFNFETHYHLGILLSVLSALLASLFTVINSTLVKNIAPVQVSFYEMAGGWLFLTLLFAFTGALGTQLLTLSTRDLAALLVLGIACTGFAFVAGVYVMKELSPFTVTLSVNLEPIYSIILAFFIFEEHKYLSSEFFIGALLILCTVLVNAYLKARPILKTRK